MDKWSISIEKSELNIADICDSFSQIVLHVCNLPDGDHLYLKLDIILVKKNSRN